MVRNILVVDDNPTHLSNLQKILDGAGYRTTGANNGQSALEAVERDRPDLIMMDVNMPVMDGFAATRALRDNDATRDLPVILVTAKDQKADKAWGKMLGAIDYITKPYTDEEVLAVVGKV